eukprot:COSAG01_NODE_47768_length_387_cov_0.857639_1_plen_39_part_01
MYGWALPNVAGCTEATYTIAGVASEYLCLPACLPAVAMI